MKREFLEGSQKYIAPEQWQAFERQVRVLYRQQGRITMALTQVA
jgi:hypothetical protein